MIQQQDTKAVTGKNSESRSSKSGVSDDAVKAFLAKKELEKKKKAGKRLFCLIKGYGATYEYNVGSSVSSLKIYSYVYYCSIF